MKFEIDKAGFQMIAEYLQIMNIEAIIDIEKDQLRIHQFDMGRTRAFVAEYPITVLEGEVPQKFALKTDWLINKIKLMKGKTITCELDGVTLNLVQERDVKGTKIKIQHEIILLDLRNEQLFDITFDEEPEVSGTVFCELPDIEIFREAFSSIDSADFFISASENVITIESRMDYTRPSTTVSLFAPSIIKDEDNRTLYDAKQVSEFFEKLKGTTVTTLVFGRDSVIVIESKGEDRRFKIYSTAMVE